ncbi:MAG: tetratricopeptide repeat protein [Bryobacterales bacterium]|nr:tetratricopeptide repeat protein [Bryobacterales bacterium]MDE0296692.1 tetratricopeptide repeat protein [Bryobacterales bacterium]
MQRIKILAAVLGLLFATAVWSQQDGGRGSGGTTGGSGGTTGGGGRSTGNLPTTGGQQGRSTYDSYRRQDLDLRRRPFYLSGKVVLANGMTPPEPVKVYLDCDGQRRPAGYTNSKGTFRVDLTDRNTPFADASMGGMGPRRGFSSSGLGRVTLFGCQLLAELGGYQADPIPFGSRSIFDNPNVGTMVLRRLDGVEGMPISFTSLSAPNKARKAYDKAFREMQKKEPNLQKAEKELETVVGLHSEYAAAWNMLGRVRMMQADREGGRTAFEKAVEADPKYLDPYPDLALLALTEERWDDGLQWSNQLLRLNPHVAIAHYYSAIANFYLGRMEASRKSVRELKEKSADGYFPQSHLILGMIHAQQGLYEQAAISFRDYLTVQPDGPVASQIQRQLHDWEVLGKIRKQEDPGAPTAAMPRN